MESFLRWCHRHSTLNKVIEIAALVLGVGLVALAASLGSWSIGLAGCALAVASAVAFFALQTLAPAHHDMKTHVFKPAHCEGGRLYYEGDLPILQIDSNDPFIAGKAQGLLLGEAIHAIQKRFDFALHTVLRRPRAYELSPLITSVKARIPPEYLREMEGLVEGYNQWVDKQRWPRPKKMTLDEVVLIHLMPDAHHLQMGGIVKSPFLRQEPVMGCTSLVDWDPAKGVIFGRNMDWPSLGVAGKYTFIKHTVKGALQTVEVAIPGLVGTLTGMNNHGLSLAMNVCPSDSSNEVRGMPTLFYNRFCLETCRSIDDLVPFLEQYSPLGAYHLTVADPIGADSIHFYQGGPYIVRRLEPTRPLATFNSRIGDQDPPFIIDQHYTRRRQQMLDDLYRGVQPTMDHEQLVEAALALPCINNYETAHTVVMKPGTRTMKVAFDNAFSGEQRLLTVPVEKLFGQRPAPRAETLVQV